MSKTVLFVGNFLSGKSGSLGVSEQIAAHLKEDDRFRILLSSSRANKYFRFLEIVSACASAAYDMLHIDVYSGNSFTFAKVAASIARLRKKPFVLTLHGGSLHEFYVGRERAFGGLFSGAIVHSPSLFLCQFFVERGFKVDYWPNPIDTTYFPLRNHPVRNRSLLWVRAFSAIYNPVVAVEVLNAVLREYPSASLTMIGPDKGLLKDTIARINQLKLQERVHIPGPVTNAELYKYYNSHEVYINTTSYESFGMSMMEAACCGIPIVSNRVGEVPHLWIEGEEIVMSKVNDVDMLAASVERIFADERFSNSLSANARKKAEQFSWTMMCERWTKFLLS